MNNPGVLSGDAGLLPVHPSGHSNRKTELAALLLGALSVLGFAPFDLFPLPLLTLAALFALWRTAASPRRAAWLGFLWGLAFFLCGVSWVYVSLHVIGGLPAAFAILATLAFCATLALFPALAGGLFAWGRSQDSRHGRDVLLAAAAWTLGEWLRGWLLTGFPWLSIGYSQTPPSPLAGYAAEFGVYGVGYFCALLAAMIAFSLRRGSRMATTLTMLGILACGFLLQHMDWTQPSGPPLKISLLQGNIPQDTKWDKERIPYSLQTYAKLAQDYPAQLLVLPETALPMFLEEVPAEYLQRLTANSPILTGVAVMAYAPDKPVAYTNAAVAITPDGLTQGYSKSHLVPFGEFTPAGFSWFLNMLHIPMSDFSPGPPRQPLLEVAGQKIAPNICYEDLFGEEIIRALPQATLLVNISNTAWFGDSLAQPQHLQIARMRALETGRTMVRATNTGMTAAIAPNGAVIDTLPAFTTAGLTVNVQGYSGATPYVRWGNALVVTIAILSLLSALRQRRRRTAAPDTDTAGNHEENETPQA